MALICLDDLVAFSELFTGIMERGENLTFQEIAHNPQYYKAMESKYNYIQQNHTWSLVDLLFGKTPIIAQWIFKLKSEVNGEPVRYKAHLVICGFQQRHDIAYQEVFAFVIRWESIRTVASIATLNNWEIHHMDVQTTFLNRHLDEEVYSE